MEYFVLIKESLYHSGLRNVLFRLFVTFLGGGTGSSIKTTKYLNGILKQRFKLRFGLRFRESALFIYDVFHLQRFTTIEGGLSTSSNSN